MILMGYLAFLMHRRNRKNLCGGAQKAEVTPKILTGDQADVAVSVCRRVGIPSETVLTGAQMDEMTDAVLGAAVEKSMFLRKLTSGGKRCVWFPP